MRTNILTMTLLGCMSTIGLMSCNNTPGPKAEKVEEATEKLKEANEELDQARVDSVNEYKLYREEMNAKFAENDRLIAELTLDLKKEKKESRAKYEKALLELQQKNETLKTKMLGYKEGAKDKWEAFKLEFNKDMDELGQSISSMAKRNMKK